jgi:predicted NAD/FAD-dependent oxidoreductase
MPLNRRQWLMQATAMASASGMGVALSGCQRAAQTDVAHGLPEHIHGRWLGPSVERAHAWRDGRLGGASSLFSAAGGPVQRVHTLVVGAGVAGLSAAHRLHAAGLDDVVVFDLEDTPGGNARGHQMQGLPCPLGAHYLPVPGEQARDLAAWLEAEGLIHRHQGRWRGNERHLCHSPQERLFMPHAEPAHGPWPGQWQEGLLPFEHLKPEALAEVRRFEQTVAQAAQDWGFAMPTAQQAWQGALSQLDQQSFAHWLDANGFVLPALRWVLDYACRDDYGASLHAVSAWAGLQYFASRHMLASDAQGAPDRADHEAVLTWPDGNAHLVARLARPLAERVQTGLVCLKVHATRHEVLVDVWSVKRERVERWVAQQVVMATPLKVSHRLLQGAVPALAELQGHLHQAPWLVSNLLMSGPPSVRAGAPLSWDNVVYTPSGVPGVSAPSLGYVDARHQSLSPVLGPHVITHYWALGGASVQVALAQRRALLSEPWQAWAQRVLLDLARVHPELPGQVQAMDLMRWGHGMVMPVPGLRSHPALQALWRTQGRIHFAHSDLSAYSVFEEAHAHGVRAADQVLLDAGMPRRKA